VANPYRTRPALPRARSADERRLGDATFAFAFLTLVMGLALTGADRDKYTLLAVAGGFAALLTRPGVR
jgi:hypothetical protein